MAGNGPGRPTAATAEELYETLRVSEEPCTSVDLADIHDTTAQTIRKKTERLLEFPGVRSKDVGKTTVYWYSTKESIADTEGAGAIGREEIVRETEQERAAKRGVWLNRRAQLMERRYSGGAAAPDTQSIYDRMDLWTAVIEYIEKMELSWPWVLEDVGHDDAADRLIDLDQWPIDADAFEYYTRQVRLFGGEYEGLAAFYEAQTELRVDINKEVGDGEGEIDVEAFDELLPEFEELLHAGDAFDEFVCEMHGYGWSR